MSTRDQNIDIDSVKTRFGIVGFHPRLISAIEIAIQVAPTDVPVLIQGENGTGKDVFSRIIHKYSKRKYGAFLAINTGAIPEGTMDSELFGHEKGAFTGAVGSRKGYFEEVDGGTFFMDEIGEMPKETQQRLLRLLENQEYLRVGSSKVRNADVRVIAATNKNLLDMIRRGKFREDLFFRLNTVSIQVPPLRERGGDIELLFTYFAHEFAHTYRRDPLYLTPDAAELLQEYRWPGNVRELKNFAEKLTILVPNETITADLVREHLNIRESYLPSLPLSAGNYDTVVEETRDQGREIRMLYDLIMDLQQQVSELKKIVYMGGTGVPGLPEPRRETREYILSHEDEDAHVAIVNGDAYEIEQPTTAASNEPKLLPQTLNLEVNEKDLICKALQKHAHNRKKAARELGISERTLYRKIKQYDI
ncbi:MAG: sigma-54 dependent transcriptional regulator [Bacteroidota bacterium]